MEPARRAATSDAPRAHEHPLDAGPAGALVGNGRHGGRVHEWARVTSPTCAPLASAKRLYGETSTGWGRGRAIPRATCECCAGAERGRWTSHNGPRQHKSLSPLRSGGCSRDNCADAARRRLLLPPKPTPDFDLCWRRADAIEEWEPRRSRSTIGDYSDVAEHRAAGVALTHWTIAPEWTARARRRAARRARAALDERSAASFARDAARTRAGIERYLQGWRERLSIVSWGS